MADFTSAGSDSGANGVVESAGEEGFKVDVFDNTMEDGGSEIESLMVTEVPSET